jgi:hypothetical protein
MPEAGRYFPTSGEGVIMDETLALFHGLPLPRPGDDPHSWVVDTTGPSLTRKTYYTVDVPYSYSATGLWVRLAMRRDRRRTQKVLRILTDWAYRLQGELHDVAGVDRQWQPYDDVANAVFFKAVLLDPRSPFVIVTVWPTGYAELWSGKFPGLVRATENLDANLERGHL